MRAATFGDEKAWLIEVRDDETFDVSKFTRRSLLNLINVF